MFLTREAVMAAISAETTGLVVSRTVSRPANFARVCVAVSCFPNGEMPARALAGEVADVSMNLDEVF